MLPQTIFQEQQLHYHNIPFTLFYHHSILLLFFRHSSTSTRNAIAYLNIWFVS